MKSPRFFPTLKARCLKDDMDEKSIQLTRVEKNIQMIMDRFESEVSTPEFEFNYCVLNMYTKLVVLDFTTHWDYSPHMPV